MPNSKNTVLVTGGAGSIGSNLCKALIAQGHRVVVIDDFSSGHEVNLPAGIQLIRGTITDEESLLQAFEAKPLAVFHLAALFANQNSVDHPEKDLSVNGLGTLKLLEKAKEEKVEKLVYFSSSCVYGSSESMSEESGELKPETPYGITKLLGEQYCRFFSDSYNLSTVVLRVFNTYGPGEFPGRYRNVVPNFFERAMNGEPLPIFGTGNETRSFTYVEDTVRGALTALTADTGKFEIFNIGTSVETKILDLASHINALTGNQAGVEFLPRRNWDHVIRRKSQVEKASQLLGFKAQVSLEEGLKQTYLWLKSHAKTDASHLVRVSPTRSSRSVLGGENTRLS